MQFSKGIYFDGHDCEDVVEARMAGVVYHGEFPLCTPKGCGLCTPHAHI